MPTKKSPAAKKPKTTTKSRVQPVKQKNRYQFVNAGWFRPVALLVVGLVVGLAIFVVNHNKSGQLSAKETADAAVQALVDCDVTKLQKYYTLGADKIDSFKQNCKPGTKYNYSKDLSAASGKLVKDNASYEYRINLPGQYEGRIMVYLVHPDDETGWQVFGFTPLDLTAGNFKL